MLPKKLTKAFEKTCYYLEYYDKNKHFPFERKKITITLSKGILNKCERPHLTTGSS